MLPLDDIYTLSDASEIDAAIELLVDRFETEFDAGRFSTVDSTFPYVDLDRLKPAVAISFLRFSFAAKQHLPNRTKYAFRLKAWLNSKNIQIDLSQFT